jgi:hypothetical protein
MPDPEGDTYRVAASARPVVVESKAKIRNSFFISRSQKIIEAVGLLAGEFPFSAS